MSTAANAIDIVTFLYDGTNLYAVPQQAWARYDIIFSKTGLMGGVVSSPIELIETINISSASTAEFDSIGNYEIYRIETLGYRPNKEWRKSYHKCFTKLINFFL